MCMMACIGSRRGPLSRRKGKGGGEEMVFGGSMGWRNSGFELIVRGPRKENRGLSGMTASGECDCYRGRVGRQC